MADAHEQQEHSPPAATQRCDFCGQPSEKVRRVALDHGYERLRTPHRELYACPRCSAEKERQRLGRRPPSA